MRKISRAYRLGLAVYVLLILIAFVNRHVGPGINLSLWDLRAVLGCKPSAES